MTDNPYVAPSATSHLNERLSTRIVARPRTAGVARKSLHFVLNLVVWSALVTVLILAAGVAATIIDGGRANKIGYLFPLSATMSIAFVAMLVGRRTEMGFCLPSNWKTLPSMALLSACVVAVNATRSSQSWGLANDQVLLQIFLAIATSCWINTYFLSIAHRAAAPLGSAFTVAFMCVAYGLFFSHPTGYLFEWWSPFGAALGYVYVQVRHSSNSLLIPIVCHAFVDFSTRCFVEQTPNESTIAESILNLAVAALALAFGLYIRSTAANRVSPSVLTQTPMPQ